MGNRKKKKNTEQNKKKHKFWLMPVNKIKLLYIFVPNLRETYLFGKKKGLFSVMAAEKLI